jgi:transcriptional regulator with PAS, ATPase and Fis domain
MCLRKKDVFIEVWTKRKKRRFYVFDRERLYCTGDRFSTSYEGEKNVPGIEFVVNDSGTSVSVLDDSPPLLFAGSKRRSIEISEQGFFSFMGSDFFVFNKESSDFCTTGIITDRSQEFNKYASDVDKALLYARTDHPIFIIGDTGTGKELIAKNIHYNSSRKHHPFVLINCSYFENETAERELFGNVAGAFTDAVNDTKGAFLAAEEGTLVIDDIGNLAPNLQAMLLRAIEAGEIKQLGSDKVKRHKARVIVISNINPVVLLKKGLLREDLFYRIEAYSVYVPELKNRRYDIRGLAEFFIGEDVLITEPAIKKLEAYDWPGNVRELRNVMEKARFVSKLRKKDIGEDEIDLRNSSERFSPKITDPSVLVSIREKEASFISSVLDRHSGNIVSASRELGICRSTLVSKLNYHKIKNRKCIKIH